jgi:hypothetical protein
MLHKLFSLLVPLSEIPDNILLFYQPSCCPEVNPATESLALPEKFSGMGNF